VSGEQEHTDKYIYIMQKYSIPNAQRIQERPICKFSGGVKKVAVNRKKCMKYIHTGCG